LKGRLLRKAAGFIAVFGFCDWKSFGKAFKRLLRKKQVEKKVFRVFVEASWRNTVLSAALLPVLFSSFSCNVSALLK